MTDCAEVLKDLNHPAKMKQLLSDLDSKKITMQQFLSECAYWNLQYLEDYRYKPLPSKPKDVTPAYIYSATKIEGINRGNFGRLKEILKNLPEEDFISRKKVSDVMKEFDKKENVFEPPKRLDLDDAEDDFWGK